MKTKMILIPFLLLFPFIVFSEQKVIEITFEIYKNDTVYVSGIKTGMGFLPEESIGSYSIKTISLDGKVLYQRNFPVFFLVMTDPPVEVDKVFKSVEVPYSDQIEYLSLEKSGKEILRMLLRDKLCNLNGKCDETETIYSCPSDCKPNSPDSLCVKDKNGFCDPDCMEGVDPDCEKRAFKPIYFVIIALLIIIPAIIFFVFRKRPTPEVQSFSSFRYILLLSSFAPLIPALQLCF